MRLRRNRLLAIVAMTASVLLAAGAASAQKVLSRGGGYFSGGLTGIAPGVVQTFEGGDIDDDGSGPRRSRQARRNSNAPAANERRLVPDEVVVELANSVSPQRIEALLRRYRLTPIESQTFQLSGTTWYRWRIPDRRSVTSVVHALEAERIVAQPNYVFALQADAPKTEGDAAQYELAKLHLPQAHMLTKGDGVLVAVIDSGIDAAHPELTGAVAQSYDALSSPMTPHKHGTAIAGIIVAHGKL